MASATARQRQTDVKQERPRRPVPRASMLPYVWMLCGCCSFSVMGALTHALGPTCDWQVIAFARSAVALLLAATLAAGSGARLVFLRPGTLWVRSIAGSISLVCTFYALTRLPIADVLTLTNLFPVWVALLSWPMLGEVPSRQVWLSVGVAVTGIVLVQQPHFAEGNYTTLLALISSFFTAIAMLGLHRLHGLDPRAIVVHFSGVSLVFCVAAFFAFEHTPLPSLITSDQTLLMLLGVGVTAGVGQLFLTKAFTAGQPAKVSVVGLSQIVFAMLFDHWLFDQDLNGLRLAGMALVVAPTAWLMLRRPRAEEPG